MAFLQDGTTVLVEYDGDDHYRDSLKIKADRAKDRWAQDSGMRVLRVPYWVQLDRTTLEHYFGLSAEIEQSFPHGFITTKLFTATFCELGVERFRCELEGLPPAVKVAIIQSLRDRIRTFGLECVLPTALRDLTGT